MIMMVDTDLWVQRLKRFKLFYSEIRGIVLRIAINEEGADALELLAKQLSESSDLLNSSFNTFKKSVNAEKDGTGILKNFFEDETDRLTETINNIALTTEAIIPRLILTANAIRNYISKNKLNNDEEKTVNQALQSALSYTIRKAHIPQSHGHWFDPDKPGNSIWIPDPEHYVSNMQYKEILKQFNIIGIAYHNNGPDFDDFVDSKVGSVYLNDMPKTRKGKNGAHMLAAIAVTNNPDSAFWSKTPEEVIKYMKDNHLVWHEKEDMHTLQPIPQILNRAFPHTGAIGYKKQTYKLAHRIKQKIGEKFVLVENKNLYAIIKK